MNQTKLFDGIEHLSIAAKDPKALARWYCNNFGFEIIYEKPKTLETFVKLGASIIEIDEAANVERKHSGDRDPGLRHIGISVKDIHKAYEHLKTKGVSLRSEPEEDRNQGQWTVFIEDPEKNLVQLIQRYRSFEDRQRSS